MPHIQEPSSSPTLIAKRTISDDERLQKIRVKNRRKLYLDRHPSYFTNPDLELSDPLLYDRCIRRFLSAAEREADGKARGYSGVLEADLYRSEAKLAALRNSHLRRSSPPIPVEASSSSSASIPQQSESSRIEDKIKEIETSIENEEEEEVPTTKEEGLERWKWEMTLRFLRGEDQDFEYEMVDRSEEWDDEVEGREEEEKWFEDEEPEWVASSGEDERVENGEKKEKNGTGGETGIQDF